MTFCHASAVDTKLMDRIEGLDVTQTQIASLCGVTQSAVSKWYTRRRIPAERVLQFSEITGIPPNELRPDVFGQ